MANMVGSQTHLVPRLIGKGKYKSLRIKVVNNVEYHHLMDCCIIKEKKQTVFEKALSVCGTFVYFFGEEPADLSDKKAIGILYSFWATDALITQLRLSYEFAKAAIGVYGHGYGSRKRSPMQGMCRFSNLNGRGSSRPHPSPAVAEDEVCLQQYFNEQQKNYLLQPYMEKKVNQLTHNAALFARKSNKYFMQLVGDTCNKVILTCGYVPRCTVKSSSPCTVKSSMPLVQQWCHTPMFGFVNGWHVDSCDGLDAKHKEGWRALAEAKRWRHCVRMIEKLENFCLPTTCGYQFLFRDEAVKASLRVYAFFSMDGLGLAVLMEDGVGHHFLGASFSHRTSLCVCKRKTDGKLSSCNVNDDFLILGWGSTGGSREARLRREASAAAAV
jgi:hypothetical protein